MTQPDSARKRKGLGKTCILALGLIALSMLCAYAFFIPPVLMGDAHEYLLMTRALAAHGSPEIRESDVDEVYGLLRANGLTDGGLAQRDDLLRNSSATAAGDVHFGHFWFYSLLAVPFWILLRAVGGNELAALQSLNALLFCLAAGVVLFRSRGPRVDRLLLLALSAIGPVVWYIRWPHPEVFTWAAALIAVVFLREKRFGWAALAASAGALQNPPLVLLALLAVVLADRTGSRRATVLAGAGAALSLLPVLFCCVRFGVPNLIVAQGCADISLISAGRVWSLLADLNQGMLPYVPLVLILGLLGGGWALARRDLRGTLVLAVLFGMILLVGVQKNWNAGCSGMIRYAVWMVPLLAWLAVDHVPRNRLLTGLLAVGLAAQAGLLLDEPVLRDYLQHNTPARFVLTRFPALYNPDPQIFAERQLGRELIHWSGKLPVPFADESGEVTKILVDAGTHADLGDYFSSKGRDPWPGAQESRTVDGLYYIHPPRGALKILDLEGVKPAVFRKQLQVRLVEAPNELTAPEWEVTVDVLNKGPHCYWGERACSPHPLKLGYRVYQGDGVVCAGRGPMPFLLKPGAVTRRTIQVALPRSPGRYRLEIGTLLEKTAWSDSRLVFRVEGSGPGADNWRGVIEAELKNHEPEAGPAVSAARRN